MEKVPLPTIEIKHGDEKTEFREDIIIVPNGFIDENGKFELRDFSLVQVGTKNRIKKLEEE